MKRILVSLLANVKSHPKRTIAIAIVLLTLIIVLAATARNWLPWVIVAAVGVGYVVSKYKDWQKRMDDWRREQERLRREQRLYIVRNAFCNAVNTLIGTLPGVFAPMGIEDICIQRVFLRGIEQIQAAIPKKFGAFIDPAVLKKYLQGKVNTLLQAGRIEGLWGVSWDGKFPLLNIDEVYDRGTYYEVFVVFADFPAATDYLTQRLFEVDGNNTPPPNVPLVDPQF